MKAARKIGLAPARDTRIARMTCVLNLTNQESPRKTEQEACRAPGSNATLIARSLNQGDRDNLRSLVQNGSDCKIRCWRGRLRCLALYCMVAPRSEVHSTTGRPKDSNSWRCWDFSAQYCVLRESILSRNKSAHVSRVPTPAMSPPGHVDMSWRLSTKESSLIPGWKCCM